MEDLWFFPSGRNCIIKKVKYVTYYGKVYELLLFLTDGEHNRVVLFRNSLHFFSQDFSAVLAVTPLCAVFF